MDYNQMIQKFQVWLQLIGLYKTQRDKTQNGKDLRVSHLKESYKSYWKQLFGIFCQK